MSLINDALKRASQSQASRPRPGLESGAPLQPVEYRQGTRRGGSLWLPVFLALAGALLSGWFFLKWRSAESVSSRSGAVTEGALASNGPNSRSATAPSEEATRAGGQSGGAQPQAAVQARVAAPIPSGRSAASEVPGNAGGTSVAPGGPSVEAPKAPEPKPEPEPEPEPQPEPFPDVGIQAIFYSKTRPVVVINGQSCRVGTTVQGAKIVEIRPNSIILEFKGRRKEVLAY